VTSPESNEKKPEGDSPDEASDQEPPPPEPGDVVGAPRMMGDPGAPPPVQPMTPPVSTPAPPPLPPTGGPTSPPSAPRTPTYPPDLPPSTKDAAYNTVYNRMGGNNNLLGWLGALFGILGAGCCCCWFLDGAPFAGGIPAIILGFLHLQRIKQQRASMAWLGWLGIVLGVVAMLGALCSFTTHWNGHLHDQLVNSY
jgi:hypothetical protein